MKNAILFLLVSILCYGCDTTKQSMASIKTSMDSWMGNSKQNLIMKWGPPSSTTSDAKDGEILIYADKIYTQNMDYWAYRMMYANGEGRLYHWLLKTNPNPPDRVDVRLLLR